MITANHTLMSWFFVLHAESSHCNLSSLRLLRLASIKAFDWLKCIYWDRQTNSIPYAQVELSLRLHEIAHFLKRNASKETKSGSKRKREFLSSS
ncbi:hypothetical protein BS78_03G310700 [Paspalum vaginatum]|nr:hypothetical protein BS78_03G310700 [Paspalum vaginatum]